MPDWHIAKPLVAKTLAWDQIVAKDKVFNAFLLNPIVCIITAPEILSH
jgi:hypothetical protein